MEIHKIKITSEEICEQTSNALDLRAFGSQKEYNEENQNLAVSQLAHALQLISWRIGRGVRQKITADISFSNGENIFWHKFDASDNHDLEISRKFVQFILEEIFS